MITLENVHDHPFVGPTRHDLFRGVDLVIPPGRYALLARDPSIRKPAIDLLAGLRPPQHGRIRLGGRCSWAIGRAGIIRGKINGFHIIGLIARLYGLDQRMCIAVVSELLSEPDVLRELVEHWSGTTRMEFMHAVALLPRFDIYVVDGTFPFAKSRFTTLWRALFDERTAGKTLILSTVRANEVRDHCDSALVLHHGRIELTHDLDQAVAKYPPRAAAEDARRERGAEPIVDISFF